MSKLIKQKKDASQFTRVLTSILPAAQTGVLPAEDAILLRPADESVSEKFLHRNFNFSHLPINLYDQDRQRQIDSFVAPATTSFPEEMEMPEHAVGGCAFVTVDDGLFFLYDRIERWADAPGNLAFIAVRIERDRILDLTAGMPGSDVLTQSEFVLLAHLLSGFDLRAAAVAIGASYDTKRKQVQVIMDKLGVSTQAALLRRLSLELTAQLMDQLLPTQQSHREIALVKRQLGQDVIVNTITIGAGLDVPVWEFGARHGKPVLYFHSMLAPILIDHDMVNRLKAAGLRWLVVPRHFMEFGVTVDADQRLERLNRALADTVRYLTDKPLVCVGESAGVPWALHFTQNNPDLVHHAVFAATPQPLDGLPGEPAMTIYAELSLRLKRDARVLAGLARTYNAISRSPGMARRALDHLYRQSEADLATIDKSFAEGFLADWLQQIANKATHASIDEFVNLNRNWVSQLPRVETGLTFVHGAQDPVSPVDEIARMVEALDVAEFRSLDGAGHFVLMQKFDQVVDLLGDLHARAEAA